MYDPVPDGLPKGFASVRYSEVAPPSDLADLVHRFWELKTAATLPEDFLYHALPDACVNLLFDQLDLRVAGDGFEPKTRVLADLVRWCVDRGFVAPNAVMRRISARLEDIRSVADMASVAGVSPRQLQRTLKRTTGFSPHDLLKILRLQRSFRADHLDVYADQSHFIHAFRAATGYTPMKYRARFRDPPLPGEEPPRPVTPGRSQTRAKGSVVRRGR